MSTTRDTATRDMFSDATPTPRLRALEPMRFNGPEYESAHDQRRLTGQILRVFATMQDGRWRTLEELARATGDPHASVSAQLRHLRKPRFGGYTVERRARGDREHGLFEYRVDGATSQAGSSIGT